MPKYLVQASYTAEGIKGLLKDGGSGRRAAVQKLCQSLGGKLESMYFAFGDSDAYMIIESPDDAHLAAAALTVCATGAVTTKTTVLLTCEEIDEAVKLSPIYRPPGS